MSRIGSVNNHGRSIKTDILGTNQLYQAEDYALEMKEKYKGVDFTLTGTPGEPMRNIAAYTGMSAVTFSAPSVIGSLSLKPEERQRTGNTILKSLISPILATSLPAVRSVASMATSVQPIT